MRSPRTTRVILLATALTLLAVVSVPIASVAQTSSTSSLPVKLIGGLTLDQQAQVIARNGGVEISSIPALRLHVIQVAPADLPQVLASYQADPQVINAEENKTRQSQTFPADPLYPNQWSLPKIGWDLVFGTVTPMGSAIVAVLDTGIDAQHPDLAGNVIPGTSILDGSPGTTDPNGHGTWVAGIVAARTDAAPLEGIAGVAYAGVRVMPVTVLDVNGVGQDSDVIAGVIWAADHGADVIVMAFSSPGFSQNLQDAIDYAWSKNVVLVAATGNDALNTPTFPAGDRGVMGVAGTDPNDTLVPFSSYGQSVFIAAPATDIQTTDIGDAYSVISGTSASAAIVAGAAAFMKAMDPTLTNGIIVGRLARMADPAGTQDQTGNGRINMARALADTGTDFIQPAGAAPVGGGGPFVGPYLAANVRLVLTGGLSIIAPPGAMDKTINRAQSFTVRITISNNNNSGDQPKTWSNISGTLTVPAGWSKTADFSSATLGNATVSGTSACGPGVTTTNCTFSWIVTPPDATSTSNNVTVNISGTPSGGGCGGGNQCSDTASVNGIALVNPAALSITSFTAQQHGAPGDVTVRGGDTIALALTVANGAGPRATANGVAGSAVTVTPTGTASATCGAASTTANIAAAASHTYTYSCGTITGDGTLVFSTSASGADENTGDTVSAGPTSSNTLTVDNAAPTSGLSPASGTVLAPFSVSWNITDPTVGGVSSGVKPGSCGVKVDAIQISTVCSGSQSLSAGSHTVDVTAQDNAGNVLTDSRSYTVVADTTAPVVTLTFPAPVTGQNGFYNATDAMPVVGTVTANDTTTGNSDVTSIVCTGAGVSVGGITGLGFPTASAQVTVAGEGTHDVSCTATDSAGNIGAGPGSAATKSVNIDTVAPDTSITANPSTPTNQTSASFSFTGTDAAPSSGGPTFECSLDVAGFTVCTSPKMYSGLADGSHTFQVRAKDTAGNVDATPASFTWVIDRQPPVVIVTFPAPNGLNGWFVTSPVVGSVTATDPSNVTAISCIDAAGGLVQGSLTGGGSGTATRALTVSGEGTHNISCTATDGAGNPGAGVGSTDTAVLKIDTVTPSISLNAAVDNCLPSGNAPWCRGTQTAGFAASDATSGVATSCAGASCNFTTSTTTNGSAVLIASGAVCDHAGNCNAGINAGPYKIDSVPPSINITAPASGGVYLLNQAVASNYNCPDATSGPNTCVGPVANGANFDTASVGSKAFKVDATDVAGNSATLTNTYMVQYASGGLCLGSPGHAILQPINADGTSVFKQKSTVPAKFRVCDALGNSVGTPGVVNSFVRYSSSTGTAAEVDEVVDSTTPDTAFRWSSGDQQWIFNISTKSLTANITYYYRITLNDGSTIEFQYGLK